MDEKKHRIAICLSGQPRFFEKGFEYLSENIIEPNEADVFFHSWFDEDSVGSSYKGISSDTGSVVSESDKKLVNLYKPKGFKIESSKIPQQPFKEGVESNERREVLSSMFYSIKEANTLKEIYEKENDFEYDWVIRARFDCALMDTVNLDEFDIDKVHFFDVLNINKEKNPVVCDYMWFSSSKNMDKMCGIYDGLGHYWKTVGINSGENITTAQMHKSKLEHESHKISLQLLRNGVPSSKFGKIFSKE